MDIHEIIWQSLFSGMDYWNGLLEWTTGMPLDLKFNHKTPIIEPIGMVSTEWPTQSTSSYLKNVNSNWDSCGCMSLGLRQLLCRPGWPHSFIWILAAYVSSMLRLKFVKSPELLTLLEL